MESQPQNPEFRINPENFHPCLYTVLRITRTSEFFHQFNKIWRIIWTLHSTQCVYALNWCTGQLLKTINI